MAPLAEPVGEGAHRHRIAHPFYQSAHGDHPDLRKLELFGEERPQDITPAGGPELAGMHKDPERAPVPEVTLLEVEFEYIAEKRIGRGRRVHRAVIVTQRIIVHPQRDAPQSRYGGVGTVVSLACQSGAIVQRVRPGKRVGSGRYEPRDGNDLRYGSVVQKTVFLFDLPEGLIRREIGRAESRDLVRGEADLIDKKLIQPAQFLPPLFHRRLHSGQVRRRVVCQLIPVQESLPRQGRVSIDFGHEVGQGSAAPVRVVQIPHRRLDETLAVRIDPVIKCDKDKLGGFRVGEFAGGNTTGAPAIGGAA